MNEGKKRMKLRFAKVLVLVLTLALCLSGCNLIEVDVKMQADEDIAEIEKMLSPVAATYDGGEVTIDEAWGSFNSVYNETNYMYSYFGMTLSHEEIHSMIQDVLEQRVRMEVVAAKYDSEYALSEEKLQEVADQADADAQLNLESALQSATGDTEEAKNESARVLVRSVGMDRDSLYDYGLLLAKYEAMEALLQDEISELSEEELQAAYDEKVSQQQESYTDGTSFETAMTGEDEIVCWKPDGYRTVKHILVKPQDDLLSAYTSAASELESAQTDLETLEEELSAANDGEAEEGERSAEEIQQEIDAIEETMADREQVVEEAAQACLDDVKDTTDAIYQKLEAGESFEDLIEEYGEDPGMQNEPTKTRGYYVSSESTNWETNFRDAAMALNQVGEYTQTPVVSGSGVHIIQYTSDVRGGEVPLEDVRDALYEEALTTAKETHSTEVMDGWVAEVNPVYDVDTFESVLVTEE